MEVDDDYDYNPNKETTNPDVGASHKSSNLKKRKYSCGVTILFFMVVFLILVGKYLVNAIWSTFSVTPIIVGDFILILSLLNSDKRSEWRLLIIDQYASSVRYCPWFDSTIDLIISNFCKSTNRSLLNSVWTYLNDVNVKTISDIKFSYVHFGSLSSINKLPFLIKFDTIFKAININASGKSDLFKICKNTDMTSQDVKSVLLEESRNLF